MSHLSLVLALILAGPSCASAPEFDACGVPDGGFAASLLPPTEQGFHDPVALDVYATPPSLTVTHERGIDGVRIVRTSGRWPAELRVAFEGFKGLEGLSVVARDTAGAEVARERSLTRTGRTEVVEGEDGRTVIVVAEPYGATLGAALLPPTACEVQLGWIDFYRR